MKTLLTGLLITTAVIAPTLAHADVDVVVGVAPPALPIYVQPPLPGDGYMWTPGYWAWNGVDYYWIPGTWVLAPYTGALWTPGYWGAFDGGFAWHGGYWADHVGFYGGINYGFGYCGSGYQGGYWGNRVFNYNRTVNNFGNANMRNFYRSNVFNNMSHSRASYNGGVGGVHAQPTRGEVANAHFSRMGPTPMQMRHEQMARQVPSQRASVNGGLPRIAASPAPGIFNGTKGFSPRASQSLPHTNAPNFVSQRKQSFVQRPTFTQAQPSNTRSSWYGEQQYAHQRSVQQAAQVGYRPQQYWSQQPGMRQTPTDYAFRQSAHQPAYAPSQYMRQQVYASHQPMRQQAYAPQHLGGASYGHASYGRRH